MSKESKQNHLKENDIELHNESNLSDEINETPLNDDDNLNNNKQDSSKKENKLTEEIKHLKEELKASNDKYIKAYADLDNYSKRLEKEKYTAIEYSAENFLKDLIPIIDNIERAIDIMEKESASEDMLTGINLTLKQILSLMAKHDALEIECDAKLDPNLHQAVISEPDSNLESGDIKEVLQKGYTYKGRVLRPTMVKVVQ